MELMVVIAEMLGQGDGCLFCCIVYDLLETVILRFLTYLHVSWMIVLSPPLSRFK